VNLRGLFGRRIVCLGMSLGKLLIQGSQHLGGKETDQ
jgi:hypothetical protein